MRITGDYHTHSKYSKNNHGKNTIAENVKSAEEKGLASYGISDHGPAHFLFGIRRKNIKKAKAELENLKDKTNLNLYFGIEANLIGKNGKIDLEEDEIKLLDNLIVGYHRGTVNNIYCPLRKLFVPEKQKKINTQAYLNCLEKYNVTIISHINTYIKVDIEKVCKKAKEKGTLIELNNKHIDFSDEEAKQLLDSGCNFIVSSDAHRKENVANVSRVLEFIEKYNVPLDRIVNIDKIYQ